MSVYSTSSSSSSSYQPSCPDRRFNGSAWFDRVRSLQNEGNSGEDSAITLVCVYQQALKVGFRYCSGTFFSTFCELALLSYNQQESFKEALGDRLVQVLSFFEPSSQKELENQLKNNELDALFQNINSIRCKVFASEKAEPCSRAKDARRCRSRFVQSFAKLLDKAEELGRSEDTKCQATPIFLQVFAKAAYEGFNQIRPLHVERLRHLGVLLLEFDKNYTVIFKQRFMQAVLVLDYCYRQIFIDFYREKDPQAVYQEMALVISKIELLNQRLGNVISTEQKDRTNFNSLLKMADHLRNLGNKDHKATIIYLEIFNQIRSVQFRIKDGELLKFCKLGASLCVSDEKNRSDLINAVVETYSSCENAIQETFKQSLFSDRAGHSSLLFEIDRLFPRTGKTDVLQSEDDVLKNVTSSIEERKGGLIALEKEDDASLFTYRPSWVGSIPYSELKKSLWFYMSVQKTTSYNLF